MMAGEPQPAKATVLVPCTKVPLLVQFRYTVSTGDPDMVRVAPLLMVISYTLASVEIVGLFGIPPAMTAEVNLSGIPAVQLPVANQLLLAAPVHVVVAPDFTYVAVFDG